MYLYIKTPRINNSKYIPHLLEHCVLHSENIDEFINITIPCYASVATCYTEFEFDKKDLDLILKKITTPISKESFETHKKVIKHELKWASFWQKSYIDTLRKVSWNKNLISNSIQEWVKFEDIVKYQKKYYQPEKMILVDDENELIKFWWMEKSLTFDSQIELKSKIEYKKIKFQWDEFDTIFTQYQNPYDILFLDFFYDLINNYTYYIDTNKWKYWHDESDISLTDKYMILSFYKWYLPKKINKDFFECYKKAYLNNIKNWKNRTYIPIIALFTWQYITKKQHIKFIENIELNTINTTILNY